jgi:ABC-type phosphate transport system auxiliary subunit
MKTTTSVTVDVDVLIEAQRVIPNISREFNEYLKHRLNMEQPKKEKKIDTIKAEKTQIIAKLNQLNKTLDKLEKEEEENKPTLIIRSEDD